MCQHTAHSIIPSSQRRTYHSKLIRHCATLSFSHRPPLGPTEVALWELADGDGGDGVLRDVEKARWVWVAIDAMPEMAENEVLIVSEVAVNAFPLAAST